MGVLTASTTTASRFTLTRHCQRLIFFADSLPSVNHAYGVTGDTALSQFSQEHVDSDGVPRHVTQYDQVAQVLLPELQQLFGVDVEVNDSVHPVFVVGLRDRVSSIGPCRKQQNPLAQRVRIIPHPQLDLRSGIPELGDTTQVPDQSADSPSLGFADGRQ